jgi:hypothetical protein
MHWFFIVILAVIALYAYGAWNMHQAGKNMYG